jgi:hypothetical protein
MKMAISFMPGFDGQQPGIFSLSTTIGLKTAGIESSYLA